LHIAFAVPEAFFLKGGTMRSARRPRTGKSVSKQKSDAASFFVAAGISQESKKTRSQAARNIWIEPRGMERIPTHAVHVPNERRAYARAQLQLPLQILRIAGHRETDFDQLMTIDISSSGVRTRCPFEIPVGTPVHLEVELVKRPSGCGTVRLVTQAQVVRTRPDSEGWHTVAFSFDEITFERDEMAPPQFMHL
jgi:PilZ domain